MAAQKREEETQPPILEPKGKQRRVRRIRSRLFFLLPHGTEIKIKRLLGCERPAGDRSSVHNRDRPGVDRANYLQAVGCQLEPVRAFISGARVVVSGPRSFSNTIPFRVTTKVLTPDD